MDVDEGFKALCGIARPGIAKSRKRGDPQPMKTRIWSKYPEIDPQRSPMTSPLTFPPASAIGGRVRGFF